MSIPVGPAPGWYDDGRTPGFVRWFDGFAWTGHTQPREFAPMGASGPAMPIRPGAAPWSSAPPWSTAPAWSAPQPPPARVGADPSDPMHWMLPVGRSWQSILAGYLGLFGLVLWVLAPFAVGFGVWALRLARSGGHGSGRAVFGIVAGVAGTLFGLVFLIHALG